TGNAIRAGVRGLQTIPPSLAFGLKPAASAMALWLPLVAAAPLARWLRGVILAAGALVLVLLPGEAAKLAVLAALLVGGVALLLPGGAGPGCCRCTRITAPCNCGWNSAGRECCWRRPWPP